MSEIKIFFMVEKINIETLNNIIDNKENFYYALLSENYYLPSLTCRAITFDWLWKVWTGQVVSIKRDLIKQGVLFKNVANT